MNIDELFVKITIIGYTQEVYIVLQGTKISLDFLEKIVILLLQKILLRIYE